MADRVFRGWIKHRGVAARRADDGAVYEPARTTDGKLKAASGVILGVCLGALAWALIGWAFWH